MSRRARRREAAPVFRAGAALPPGAVPGALLLAALLAAPPAAAVPDFGRARSVGGVEVFADHRRTDLYYYAPLRLELLSESDGRPVMRLLQARYLGTGSAGDRGTAFHRSVLSFQVGLVEPPPELRREVRRLLGAGRRSPVELRPVPVDRLETALVFAPVGEVEGDAGAERLMPAGDLEAEGEEGRSSRDGFWRQRRFALRLDPPTAQLVVEALGRGQGLFSLGYALFARGIDGRADLDALTGSARLVTELRRRLEQHRSAGEGTESAHLILSGAASMAVDLERWPGILHRVDLNERTPPGYAALEIYCFDFRDRLRPEVALKRVEIEARGVDGGTVRREATFEAAAPELTLHSLRFPFAVRLDRPYRYRVVEVGLDGRTAAGPWRTRDSWEPLLVVTGPIEVVR
jgi:hypothetical protein